MDVTSRKHTSLWWRENLSYLLLPFNDMRQLGVGDPRVQLTLHESRSLVVFDVSQVSTLRHFDVFGKALWEKKKLLAEEHDGRTQGHS